MEYKDIKVGDIVKVITQGYGYSQFGDIGVVTGINEHSVFPIRVDFKYVNKATLKHNTYSDRDIIRLNKYRVGDKVTLHGEKKVRTIEKIQWGLCCVFIASGYPCFEEELSPVTDTKVEHDFIVVLFKDDRYLPSSMPYIHKSREAAETESKRLSALHGGKFRVLQVISEATTPPPVKRETTLITF